MPCNASVASPPDPDSELAAFPHTHSRNLYLPLVTTYILEMR